MIDHDIEPESDDLDIELVDDRLALDRRTIDVDGRMHVPDCNFSKANVCPYIGSEIPGYVALGLDPGKIYQVYRDRKALAAAASTFENSPLMFQHVEVSAASPQKSLTVGVCSNIRWRAPYLVCDLAVWDGEAIRAVQNESQRELSAGYRYVPIVEPGTVDGEPYEIRMSEIVGNHIALVSVGRAGPDVMVRDEAPRARPMAEVIPGFDRLFRRGR